MISGARSPILPIKTVVGWTLATRFGGSVIRGGGRSGGGIPGGKTPGGAPMPGGGIIGGKPKGGSMPGGGGIIPVGGTGMRGGRMPGGGVGYEDICRRYLILTMIYRITPLLDFSIVFAIFIYTC